MQKLVERINLSEEIIEITAPGNIGVLYININEEEIENSEHIRRMLSGIVIRLIENIEDDYIPIDGHTYLWNTHKDSSMLMTNIPSEALMSITPIIDEHYRKQNKVDITDLPISIYFKGFDATSDFINASEVAM